MGERECEGYNWNLDAPPAQWSPDMGWEELACDEVKSLGSYSVPSSPLVPAAGPLSGLFWAPLSVEVPIGLCSLGLIQAQSSLLTKPHPGSHY